MKKARTGAALILAGLAVVISVFGVMKIQSAKKEWAAAEASMPESAISTYIAKLKNKDYKGIYADSQIVEPSINSEEDYIQRLEEVFAGVDPDHLDYVGTDNDDGTKSYQMYASGKLITRLKLVQTADQRWLAGTVFAGDNNYTVEVPQGLSITVNGIDVDSTYIKETGVPASNFAGLDDQGAAPKVDVYVFSNLLSKPQIAVKGEADYGTLDNVLDNTIYVGRVSSDADLAQTMIADALICARFPAKEASVGEVGAISVRGSDWWRRISGMQNNWFSSHSVSGFSNEQALNIIQQSADTMVGYVTFDYYARSTDGTQERTWHGGYQMTFLQENGQWKIAGMAINNELNPARQDYFAQLNQ